MHIVKWFQVLPSNTIDSISVICTFVCTQLNGFQVLLSNTIDSMSIICTFVCTQLNGFKFCHLIPLIQYQSFVHLYCDGKFFKIPKTGLYFCTFEDGAGWHLIPCWISPRSEFFSQAYKKWHFMWGINLWPDWPPLARCSKFHTMHIPTKAASLPPLEQWKIWASKFSRNNISKVVGNSGFPCDILKEFIGQF